MAIQEQSTREDSGSDAINEKTNGDKSIAPFNPDKDTDRETDTDLEEYCFIDPVEAVGAAMEALDIDESATSNADANGNANADDDSDYIKAIYQADGISTPLLFSGHMLLLAYLSSVLDVFGAGPLGLRRIIVLLGMRTSHGCK